MGAAFLAAAVLLVAAIMLTGKLLFRTDREPEVEGEVWDAEIGGVKYVRRRLTHVLLLVSDADASEEGIPKSIHAEASALALISFDHKAGTYSVLQIDPDSFVRFRMIGENGGVSSGSVTDRIGLAQVYGGSVDLNSLNTMDAVSELLFGLPVDYYICFDKSAVPVTGGRITDPAGVLADFCTRMIDEEAETDDKGLTEADRMYLAANVTAATLTRFSGNLIAYSCSGTFEIEGDPMTDSHVRRIALRRSSLESLAVKLYYERVDANQ